MIDGKIRSTFVNFAQVMTTQAQAMMAQANRYIGPRVQPIASTTTSRLREFTRIDSFMFCELKVNEDPQDFIDEVY